MPRGVLDENYPYDGVFPMTGFKDPYFKANISIYICYYRTCTQGAPWRACGGTRCQSRHHQCGGAWIRNYKMIPRLRYLLFVFWVSPGWLGGVDIHALRTVKLDHCLSRDIRESNGHHGLQKEWGLVLGSKIHSKPVFTWFSQYTLGQWPKSPAWYFSIICAIPRFVRMYLGVREVKVCLSISVFFSFVSTQAYSSRILKY